MSDWTDNPQTDCEAVGEHHGERLTHEEPGYRQYTCDVCGAEWWEDDDE